MVVYGRAQFIEVMVVYVRAHFIVAMVVYVRVQFIVVMVVYGRAQFCVHDETMYALVACSEHHYFCVNINFS